MRATDQVTGTRSSPVGPAPSTGPDRRNVLGVLVDVVSYRQVIDRVLAAAAQSRPLTVTALAVHGVMTAVHDPAYAARLNALDIVAPDGQPVRWALNLLYRVRLRRWVSGPELVGRLLAEAAERDVPVFLYGSTPDTLEQLTNRLHAWLPELRIVGSLPSEFRSASEQDQRRLAARISASGARLVLVGLGCPRQEIFIHAMAPRLSVPLLAVGAAFDYHAGRLCPAPRWMQGSGLAWMSRLRQEPRRLWRRYLLLGPEYLVRLAAQKARMRRPVPVAPAREAPGPIAI